MDERISLVPEFGMDSRPMPPFPTSAIKALGVGTRWLISPAYPQEWVNNELTASCGAQRYNYKPEEMKGHFVHCTCGIYGTFEARAISGYLQRTRVPVIYEPFGSVVEAHCGVKSTQAQIVAVMLMPADLISPVSWTYCEQIADRFGLPVMHHDEWAIRSGARKWSEYVHWLNNRDVETKVWDIRNNWEGMCRYILHTQRRAEIDALHAKLNAEFEAKMDELNGIKRRKRKKEVQ